MRRALIMAAAAAGLFAAAPAAGAAVLGVQDDRLTSGPVEAVPERAALIRATGAKITRIDVLWSLVAPTRPQRPADPDDPAYRWERTDATLRAIADLGVTPIVAAYSAPAWAAGGRGIPPGTEVNPNAPSPALYASFMRALAQRYSGAHRPPGAAGPLPRVRHFEIWNEPNLAAFLSPQVAGGRRVAVTRYVDMLRRAHREVKAVSPRAIVIAGAGGPRSSTDARGTGALAWAQTLARSGAPFDAYSQHIYPAAAPLQPTAAFPAWATLPQLFAALDAVPRRRGLPVYLTEIGYTTARTQFRDVRVTQAQQARYLRQIVSLPAVRSGRVRALIWFNLQDNPNWPAGLRDLRGRTKPSHAAFVARARASRLTPDLRVEPPVTLSRGQLLINQRISQAAVRRLNAVAARLDAGLTRDDLRPGGIGPTAFAAGVQVAVGPSGPAAPPPPRTQAADAPPAPARRAGAAARVRLSAAQLLINQRISQAAVRRANGLEARRRSGLTGGDLRPGAIDASRLVGGIGIASATAPAVAPAPTATVVAAARRGDARDVALSAAQLSINQRIAQAGVRRANALAGDLAAGLVGDDFRPGSISALSLAPGLVSPPGG